MTPAARLRARLDDLIAEVRRGRVPAWARSDLALHLEALRVSPKRIKAAITVSQEHSREIEAGIRLAAGAAPLAQRGVAGMVQLRILRRRPAAYGLKRVPCLKVIRRVLSAMLTERNMRLSMTTVSQPTARTGYASPMTASPR